MQITHRLATSLGKQVGFFIFGEIGKQFGSCNTIYFSDIKIVTVGNQRRFKCQFEN